MSQEFNKTGFSVREITKEIIDQIDIGFFLVDRTFSIVLWNRWMRENVNDDFAGKSLFDMFPEIEDELRPKYEATFDQGMVWVLSHEFHKDIFPVKNRGYGDDIFPYRQLNVKITLLANNGDGPLAMTVLEDVTSKRLALLGIRERERKEKRRSTYLNSILNAADVMVIVCDLEGRILHFNHKCESVCGCAFAEVENKCLWDVFFDDPAEAKRHMKDFKNRGPKEYPYTVESRWTLSSKNGTQKLISWTYTPLLDDNGRILNIIGAGTDITKRKRAEAERARLYSAIKQTVDGIVLTDLKGTIQFVNPAFERMTGYTAEEAIGNNSRLLKSGCQDDAFYKTLWARLTSGQVWHGHLKNRRKDGSLYDEEMTIAPVFSEGHDIIGYVAVKRDVTEALAVEAHLRQQQKLESLGTLASGVAHEINNPIAGIMNYAQLLIDKSDGDTNASTVEYASEIITETERVADIVRNLLAFARPDKRTGRTENIAEVLEQTLSLGKTIMRRDNVIIEVDVPQDLPRLFCDSQQIQQVLLNLLTNARDALNERYPTHDEDKIIEIKSRQFEKEGAAWIRVTVEDHGAGISSSEVRDRVFDPFFTTKRARKGTGLGLSVSHKIIEEQGGNLSLECEPGKYTRFHIELPVEKGKEGEKVKESKR